MYVPLKNKTLLREVYVHNCLRATVLEALTTVLLELDTGTELLL